MENKEITMLDLLIESHVNLERQGPGSKETTLKALSFIGNPDKILRAADLGCGTGGQTMVIAQNIAGRITGLDLSPDFINAFKNNAKKLNLQDKTAGVVGSMDNLPFQQEEFDLIWSEGAIDHIGFENGLEHWHSFLKKSGYIAVTCPSWLSAEHPTEVQNLWEEAGSRLDTVEYNISAMQNAGYSFIAAFALPENCWTENYFIPLAETEKVLLKKYAGSKTAEDFFKSSRYEAELYSKYKQFYGYVFYIGKKI